MKLLNEKIDKIYEGMTDTAHHRDVDVMMVLLPLDLAFIHNTSQNQDCSLATRQNDNQGPYGNICS